ncbi:MAG: SRPBCC family protein [Candidatus Acidiferrales bacterium]
MGEVFLRRTRIEAPAETLFRWHAEPGALERLSPPWEPVEEIERAPGIRDGNRGVLGVHWGPLLIRWEFEHRNYAEGRQFQDVQTKGPFKSWVHTHSFTPDGATACWLEDRIEYEMPLGFLGRWIGGRMVRRKLERLFECRHRVTAEAMAKAKTRDASRAI